MSELEGRYPRTIDDGSGEPVVLRWMTEGDGPDVLDFAESLPRHDLLFLRRDITEQKVVQAWMRSLEDGGIRSLVAEKNGKLIGCSALVVDPLSFSSHVGEMRVLLAADERSRGLGRVLIQECFLGALDAGLDKLTAFMTADQTAAIAVFEEMGFKAEALLRDHVRDRDGVPHDIVLLANDVQAFEAQRAAYGAG